MKKSIETITAEIAGLEAARDLATMAGYGELARIAGNEVMALTVQLKNMGGK